MSDMSECPPMTKSEIKSALATIHYTHSMVDPKAVCGKKNVPLSDDGDAVDCKNCRRRFFEGKVGDLYYDERWTRCCSGCCEHPEMSGCPSVDGRGAGCHECGYQGKVRDGFHAPINKAARVALGLEPTPVTGEKAEREGRR